MTLVFHLQDSLILKLTVCKQEKLNYHPTCELAVYLVWATSMLCIFSLHFLKIYVIQLIASAQKYHTEEHRFAFKQNQMNNYIYLINNIMKYKPFWIETSG